VDPSTGADRPAEPAGDAGPWTAPNLITAVRLLCIPLFVWLLFGLDAPAAAAALLALLGATDWVDGWIARHFDQGSEIGKVLDPTADRILLIATAVALLVQDLVPMWFGILVLVREALIALAVVVLALIGARRIDVQWSGKAGTLALMFAFPAFVFADQAGGFARTAFLAGAWVFAIGGLLLSYWAAVQYVPLARAAVREGRGSQRRVATEETAP